MFLSAFVHSLSRYDGLEAWQTSKLQNRRPLFDVELYLTVHKSFVSTSLNIIHRFISAVLKVQTHRTRFDNATRFFDFH